jgi:hypothetical protein
MVQVRITSWGWGCTLRDFPRGQHGTTWNHIMGLRLRLARFPGGQYGSSWNLIKGSRPGVYVHISSFKDWIDE